MKCVNGEKQISQEEIEHVASLIGGTKVRCEDGNVIITPVNNEDLSKAVASVVSHGVSVSPSPGRAPTPRAPSSSTCPP